MELRESLAVLKEKHWESYSSFLLKIENSFLKNNAERSGGTKIKNKGIMLSLKIILFHLDIIATMT